MTHKPSSNHLLMHETALGLELFSDSPATLIQNGDQVLYGQQRPQALLSGKTLISEDDFMGRRLKLKLSLIDRRPETLQIGHDFSSPALSRWIQGNDRLALSGQWFAVPKLSAIQQTRDRLDRKLEFIIMRSVAELAGHFMLVQAGEEGWRQLQNPGRLSDEARGELARRPQPEKGYLSAHDRVVVRESQQEITAGPLFNPEQGRAAWAELEGYMQALLGGLQDWLRALPGDFDAAILPERQAEAQALRTGLHLGNPRSCEPSLAIWTALEPMVDASLLPAAPEFRRSGKPALASLKQLQPDAKGDCRRMWLEHEKHAHGLLESTGEHILHADDTAFLSPCFSSRTQKPRPHGGLTDRQSIKKWAPLIGEIAGTDVTQQTAGELRAALREIASRWKLQGRIPAFASDAPIHEQSLRAHATLAALTLPTAHIQEALELLRDFPALIWHQENHNRSGGAGPQNPTQSYEEWLRSKTSHGPDRKAHA